MPGPEIQLGQPQPLDIPTSLLSCPITASLDACHIYLDASNPLTTVHSAGDPFTGQRLSLSKHSYSKGFLHSETSKGN